MTVQFTSHTVTPADADRKMCTAWHNRNEKIREICLRFQLLSTHVKVTLHFLKIKYTMTTSCAQSATIFVFL